MLGFIRGKVDIRGADECWPWTAGVDRDGYGLMKPLDGRRSSARPHRAAFEAGGVRIPPGMMVLHSCDNPPCCNPRHLRIGTHADNMDDRHIRGRTSGLISRDTVDAVIRDREAGLTYTEIERRHGVDRSWAHRVVNRRMRTAR